MKQYTCTAYRCDHCNKNYLRKHAAEKHEKYCNQNPENFHACYNECKYLEQTKKVVYGDEYGSSRNVTIYRCTKLDKILYNFKAEALGLLSKYPEHFEGQERMPRDCEHLDQEMPF